MPYRHLTLVAHADWSVGEKKRWLAVAVRLPDGGFRVYAPIQVGDPGALLTRLQNEAGRPGCVLAGFDFPIGLPVHFARLAGISDFLTLLPALGQEEWSEFYLPARKPEEISLRRPFYPSRPGEARQIHLLNKLQATSIDQLRRRCELPHPHRRAACPLFWTLGGQQVGKAAITGWRELLVPALGSLAPEAAIWPFSGVLEELLQPGRLVLAECYPGETYHRLGVTFSRSRRGARSGKRVQGDRIRNAPALLDWAERANLALSEELQESILSGFGPSPDGEDPFDAVVGLFGMLDIVLGSRSLAEPQDEEIRRIEGWIFGQEWPD